MDQHSPAKTPSSTTQSPLLKTLSAEDRQLEWLAFLFTSLQALVPSREMTQEAIELYISEMKVLADEIGHERMAFTIRLAIRESNRWPTIADLRRLAGASLSDAQETNAIAAWAWCIEYVDRHGIDGHIFSHPIPPALDTCQCRGMGWIDEATSAAPEKTARRVVRCPCRKAAVILAPAIPPQIQEALRSIGGLQRIQRAIEEDAAAQGRDYGFCRRDFIDAHKRARATFAEHQRLAAPAANALLKEGQNAFPKD